MNNNSKHSKILIILVVLFVTALSGMLGTFAWENLNQRAFNATYQAAIEVEVEKRIFGEEGNILPGAQFILEQEFECEDESDSGCVDGFQWQQLIFDLPAGGYQATFTTDVNGRFTLMLPPGRYRLVEVGVPSGFELVDNNPYTVFEVVIGDDGEIEIVFDDEFVDLIPIYNERLDDELAVDKIVVNEDGSPLTEAQRNQLFTFDVELRYDGRVLPAPHAYTVYRLIFDEAGNVTGVGEQLRTGFTTNTGLFQLRHGERAVFRDIPVGTDYEVNETIPIGFNVTKSGSVGVITDQRNADELLNHVVVVNEMRREQVLPDDGYIVVEKSVIGPINPELHPTCFWFTIVIGDFEPYRTCIAPGGSWTSHRFPVGTPFTVTEDDYSHLGIISVPGRISGQIITGRHTVSFTNIVQPEDGGDDGDGDLEISKRVVGEGFDPEKEFTFLVTLNGFTTLPVEIEVDRNGVFDRLIEIIEPGAIHQWVGDFSLRDGETITLRNIPAGVNFTVSERHATDYVQGVINFDGVIARDHTSIARFTNEYRPGDPGLPPEDGELDVCKVLTDLSDAPGVDFFFELWVFDSGRFILYDTFVLRANECLSDVTSNRNPFRLPFGTRFRVIEPADEIPAGFVFGRSFGEAGTIQASNQAIFFNEREYVEIPVEKLWNFNELELDLPEYIVVYLLANGQMSQVRRIFPDENGNWEYTFRARRANADGDIVYTVEERPVSGWKQRITADDEGGFIITNSAFVPEDGDEVEVEKILIGEPEDDAVFEFTMTPVTVGAPTPNPNRISITGEGTEAFGQITFTQPGVFEYLVREVIPADQGDFNFDVRVYLVTFTVTSDDDGNLTVVGPVITLDDQVVSHIEFINEYVPCEDCEECDTVDFIFTKVNANGTTPLEGAEFSLYAWNTDDEEWITPAIMERVSAINGRVIFEELTFSGRYRLVETSAPDGFITPTGYWIVTVSDEGVITVTAVGDDQPEFVNNNVVANTPSETEPDPETIDFGFTKINADTEAPLEGAVFNLYARNDDDTDWITPARTLISDADGRVVFTGLTLGSQYRLVEISAPIGFETPTGYWIVTVSDDGEITVTTNSDDQPEFTNNNVVANTPTVVEPGTVNFEFTKINANGGTPLAGAEFNLYARNDDDSGWETSPIQERISAAGNGRVVFAGLTYGSHYRLIETSAPDGFITPTGYWIVEVSDEGEITVTAVGDNQPQFANNSVVANTPVTDSRTVDFEFTKVNAANGATLAGANFSLYARNAANTGWVTPAIQTNVSATNGRVVFTGLTYGSQYRLRETSAPFGFITPTGYWVINVSDAGVISITTHGANQPAFTNNNNNLTLPNRPLVVHPGTANFEFMKVNNTNGAALAGAHFSLYARNATNTGWTTPAIQTGISGTNGRVVFTGLTHGSQYRLRETSAPTGFITPTGYWIINVSPTGDITTVAVGTGQPAFTNNSTVLPNRPLVVSPGTVNFQFTKVNAANESSLAGANFSLYARNAAGTGWLTPAIQTDTSRSSGRVTFTGLTLGGEYRLRETSAPTGFITPTGYWIINVSQAGVITITARGTGQPAFTNNNSELANTPTPDQPNRPGNNQPGRPGGNQPGPGNNNQSRPPQTSDEGQMHFWMRMTVVSGTGLMGYILIGLYVKRRKRQY